MPTDSAFIFTSLVWDVLVTILLAGVLSKTGSSGRGNRVSALHTVSPAVGSISAAFAAMSLCHLM
jgi:hypothetical protein